MILGSVVSFIYPIIKYHPILKSFSLVYEHNLSAAIFFLRMPKYAVAKGRKIGIYDTWKECEEQVKGYHQAKYKKFDSLSEAEEFILQNSTSFIVENTVVKNVIDKRLETESFSIPQISPANLNLNTLHNTLYRLEERLNTFMQDTHNTLSDIQKRLVILESKQNVSTSVQLVKNTTNLDYVEYKGIKRSLENECSTLCKAMKMSSDQESIGNSNCGTSNDEHCKYNTTEDGFVNVYTDGACSNNGKLGAKAGIGVWFNKNHPLNVSEPVRGYATNNNAEIQAATKAILQASKAGITKLNVHTDSQFMIKCITSWINKWKRNNWKLKDGGLVKNKEELICLDEAIQNMECVKWTYVKGHSGDIGNNEADALARKGAERYQCNITYGFLRNT